MKMICVYCGSRDGNAPRFAEAAEEVGNGIAARGLGLVYGAGDVGLMGRVARTALDGGAPVVGVIPHHLKTREIEKTDLTEIIAVDSMHERKMIMFKRADAFVALPGGPGTLDELIELLTWRQLGLHEKPAHLLNLDGYWDPLLTLLNNCVNNGFANSSFLEFLTVHNTVEDLLAAL
ncbi:MAG: TIGR00730 family Rossman fold protein [Pseudomonadota bacterium]